MNLEKQEFRYSGGKQYINICQEIRSHDEESIFNDTDGNDERKEIRENENLSLHASGCVEILDKIPFDEDQLDDDELSYYDSRILIHRIYHSKLQLF